MKQKTLTSSELILNPDGSIYHLNLLPEQLADTVITVGDPDRVSDVSKYFDILEVEIHKREFKTHTGSLNGKRISVISTGIGTDNIDIVFNELDALVNIDFDTRTIKNTLKSLTIVRIGTSGAIQPEIPVDSFLVSEKAIGFDSLLWFYNNYNFFDEAFADEFIKQNDWSSNRARPYVVNADSELLRKFVSKKIINGITATNVGFYGPQGRVLRLSISDSEMNNKLRDFRFKGKSITNLEMETSGIYGMARLLGHKAISLNAILANRAKKTFSKKPQETVDNLIKHSLQLLTE